MKEKHVVAVVAELHKLGHTTAAFVEVPFSGWGIKVDDAVQGIAVGMACVRLGIEDEDLPKSSYEPGLVTIFY